MNIVPKTGGNALQGSVVLQRHRQEPAVRQLTTSWDAGLPRRRRSTKVYDLNGAFGGPIKKDRVWYFVNARTQGSTRVNANQFYNLNAGDPDEVALRAGLRASRDSPTGRGRTSAGASRGR